MGSDLSRAVVRSSFIQFQFTLPHGERPGHPQGREGALCFNSRSRMGSDLDYFGQYLCNAFQFTLPHGERRSSCSAAPATAKFQFTLPHGERHPAHATRFVMLGFNSRSRMGSDFLSFGVGVDDGVSIHAPAWGATSGAGTEETEDVVSIHAPAWGATRACGWSREPTSVSIHAPAWGATVPSRRRRGRRRFQFTLPHGERHVRASNDLSEEQFQFTLPHGERRR